MYAGVDTTAGSGAHCPVAGRFANRSVSLGVLGPAAPTAAVVDEPDARQLVTRILQSCNEKVNTAASVSDAMAQIRSDVPQVLISDLGMPDQDGYELIQTVRALPADAGGNIPAVALSAFARSEDRRRAILAGFQTHVAKPVEPPELIAVVASLAGKVGRATSE